VIALFLAACAPAPEAPTVPGPSVAHDPRPLAPEPGKEPGIEPVDDVVSTFVRASIDLRGVRPTIAELDGLQADPASLDERIAALTDGPRFGARVRGIWQEILFTDRESVVLFDPQLVSDHDAFEVSFGQEALRLVEHVVTTGQPYDRVITSDVTVVDEVLATYWPTDYPPGGTGWQVARYLDGRPAAGVLATNNFMWAYPSTESNRQRKRANQISRAFVCQDYLETEVPFDADLDLLDEEALENAVANDPSCLACHETLDPIASALWGFDFYFADALFLAEGATYHPDREARWQTETGRAPAWHGQTVAGLAELARAMTRDPRFDACVVEHLWRYLLRRAPLLQERAVIDAYAKAFEADGRQIDELLVELVADPRYRAATDAGGGVPRKLVTPDLLASQIEDLTGFVWRVDDPSFDVLDSDEFGLLSLGGGANGTTVTEPAAVPNATVLLVHDRLASAAAQHAVSRERALAPTERRLFREIGFTEGDDVAGQMRVLHRRVLGRAPGDAETAALVALWEEVRALHGTPFGAWAAVLGALLRDPAFVTY